MRLGVIFGPVGIRGIGLGLALVAQVYVAKAIGVQSYGYFALLVLISQMISGAVTLGVSLDAMRITVNKHRGRISAEYKNAVAEMTGRLRIALLVGLTGYTLWDIVDVGMASWLVVFSLSCFGGSLSSLNGVRANILKGKGKAVLAILPEQMVRPLAFILISAHGLKMESPIENAAFYYFCGISVNYIAGIVLFAIQDRKTAAAGDGGVEEADIKTKGAKTSWKLEGFSYLNTLLRSVDLVVLGFVASEEARGIYAACLKIANSGISMIDASLPLAYKAVSKQINNTAKLRTTILKWGATFWLVSLPMFVAIYVLKDDILLFFGRDFSQGTNALAILLVGRFAVVPMLICTSLIILQRNERTGFVVSVVFIAVAIIFEWAGWVSQGLAGVAFGASISLFLYNVAVSLVATKYLPRRQKTSSHE